MDAPYRFDGYLQALGGNWHDDDAWLRQVLAFHDAGAIEGHARALSEYGRWCAGEMRVLSDEGDRAEFWPRLKGKDPYHRKLGEIELCEATRRLFSQTLGRGLAGGQYPWVVQYALIYLQGQNGEAGVGCSTVCTDGLYRALGVLGRTAFHRDIRAHIAANTPERYVHGAQFVTEIQGGSDAATNILEARPDGPDGWHRLWGDKWFCSNGTADYWLLTARPTGAPEGPKGVALFVMSRRDGDAPNGYVIERLKDKLGTRALPTAEIAFQGARAQALGPLEDGLKNMVALVLVTSRVANVLAAAAMQRRVLREAEAYTSFRSAFGKKLAEMPLVAATVRRLAEGSERALAGAFALIALWERMVDLDDDDPAGAAARVLVSLAKPAATEGCTMNAHAGMMLLGGNGIEERFCALPRILRDSIIYETWEGPHNLLIMQAHKDLRRFGFDRDPARFLEQVMPGGEHHEALAADLGELLAHPRDPGAILAFKDWAARCWHAFEAHAAACVRTGAPVEARR